MDDEYIRPNLFYLTFTQIIVLSIYLGVVYGAYLGMIYFFGFDFIEHFEFIINAIDPETLTFLIETVEHHFIKEIILFFVPVILFLYNTITEEIKIKDNKIFVKEGIFKKPEEFYLNELVRFKIKKDLGFLNAGVLTLYTKYGDRFKIDSVVNLKRAEKILRKAVAENKEIKQEVQKPSPPKPNQSKKELPNVPE
ncbi:MAG: hypothetical protein MAG795_00375 [Candidatus Woesearchaeota archaeon]|nr:hypothetical protein [Candidatus Woesearchaeota archaeon]